MSGLLFGSLFTWPTGQDDHHHYDDDDFCGHSAWSAQTRLDWPASVQYGAKGKKVSPTSWPANGLWLHWKRHWKRPLVARDGRPSGHLYLLPHERRTGEKTIGQQVVVVVVPADAATFTYI